jgi:hypothetical protein
MLKIRFTYDFLFLGNLIYIAYPVLIVFLPDANSLDVIVPDFLWDRKIELPGIFNAQFPDIVISQGIGLASVEDPSCS